MLEKRKQILQMVEEGKLTVDEALTLLNSLEANPEANPEPAVNVNTSSQLTPYVGKSSSSSSTFKPSSASFKEKLFSFVDQTVKKVKDVDLDFNFGPSFKVQHIFQQTEAYIQAIDIDIANGSVKVKPWGSPDVRIECESDVYKVEGQEQARQAFLKDVLFSIENGKLKFNVQKNI
ncbi:SHOCT-like domain-containing protein [Priestia flexa]